MNTDRFLSVFICVHLWFRSYFWLRLGCIVEFVANKTDHEFHEFHENDRCHLDVIGLKYNFFAVSPAALPDSHF